jgi:hypothetical protein
LRRTGAAKLTCAMHIKPLKSKAFRNIWG